MAVVRRATDVDAVWARAWTADTFADLATIPTGPGFIGPRHGDVAYVTDEGVWYNWRDDDTWEASGGSPAFYMSPLTTGGDPTTAELIFGPDGDVVMLPVLF